MLSVRAVGSFTLSLGWLHPRHYESRPTGASSGSVLRRTRGSILVLASCFWKDCSSTCTGTGEKVRIPNNCTFPSPDLRVLASVATDAEKHTKERTQCKRAHSQTRLCSGPRGPPGITLPRRAAAAVRVAGVVVARRRPLACRASRLLASRLVRAPVARCARIPPHEPRALDLERGVRVELADM